MKQTRPDNLAFSFMIVAFIVMMSFIIIIKLFNVWIRIIVNFYQYDNFFS